MQVAQCAAAKSLALTHAGCRRRGLLQQLVVSITAILLLVVVVVIQRQHGGAHRCRRGRGGGRRRLADGLGSSWRQVAKLGTPVVRCAVWQQPASHDIRARLLLPPL